MRVYSPHKINEEAGEPALRWEIIEIQRFLKLRRTVQIIAALLTLVGALSAALTESSIWFVNFSALGLLCLLGYQFKFGKYDMDALKQLRKFERILKRKELLRDPSRNF